MTGWRHMIETDLDAVLRVAAEVHTDLPERRAVLAERLALFPAGCLAMDGGYVIAHPVRLAAPPPLDTLLGALPDDADALHLHDVALLPAWQGRGLGAAAVRLLGQVAHAHRLPRLSLIAVHGTAGYWRRLGFAETGQAPAALASYGPAATHMATPRNVTVDPRGSDLR